jgi:CRP-like cAMP-binding protein
VRFLNKGKDHDSGCEKQARLRPPSVSWQDRRRQEAYTFPKKQVIFVQGDLADAVFYIQTGKVKLTVVSKTGNEATIGILGD